MSFSPLVGCTGFEAGHVDVTRVSERKGASISSTKHSGAYGLELRADPDSYARADMVIEGAGNEVYVSAWIRTDDSDYADFCVYAGEQWVGVSYDGEYWNACVGASTVASGTLSHPKETWRRVSMHIVIDNSGTIETKIDGTADISYNGDTYLSGSSNVEYVRMYINARTYYTDIWYIDDILVGTGDWPGDIRFAPALVPDGDTAQKDWTPSTGSVNWDMVDEVPPNDADYVSVGSANHKDLYTVSDWTPGTNEEPQFLVDWMRAKKESAESVMLRSVIKSGGVESSGGSLDLTTDYAYYSRVIATEPSTGSSWTEATINAIEIGQEHL